MLSQNKIKYLTALQLKKNRAEQQCFVAEGDKICTEIIREQKIEVQNIFATDAWLAKNEVFLKPFSKQIESVTEAELKKVSTLSTPNQALIVARKPIFQINKTLISQSLVLYLDGIQDPGNMGTILRNADWFGIPYVFCSDTCVDIYNPKVIQASMGAFLRVQSQEIELAELLKDIPTIPVYGALLEGENIFKTTLQPNAIIVIGSEGKGIAPHNLTWITDKIKIPSQGAAESLNAAVATGIICSLFRNL
jgi:RNA methyltransferase, TrmH family